MNCTNCGTSLDGSASACGKCGLPVEKARSPAGSTFVVFGSRMPGGPKLSPWLTFGVLFGFLVCLGAIAIPNSHGHSKLTSNEISAISTLRNLASSQAQLQASGKIDCDGDRVGEYGTFLELTMSSPVRTRPDYGEKGQLITPPMLSPALAGVDAEGIVSKSGYFFRIFLPGDGRAGGPVHEKGPAATPGLSGTIDVGLSETTWCAYAWPVARGNSGNRCFFVNQAGDVMQSRNEVAKWSGKDRPPAPNSAFVGAGITGRVAVGSVGRDGDVWKVAN